MDNSWVCDICRDVCNKCEPCKKKELCPRCHVKVHGEAKGLKLKLVPHDANEVLLVVDGVFCGNLLVFKADGTITRCAAVNPALGFDLDAEGRIKLEGER